MTEDRSLIGRKFFHYKTDLGGLYSDRCALDTSGVKDECEMGHNIPGFPETTIARVNDGTHRAAF